MLMARIADLIKRKVVVLQLTQMCVGTKNTLVLVEGFTMSQSMAGRRARLFKVYWVHYKFLRDGDPFKTIETNSILEEISFWLIVPLMPCLAALSFTGNLQNIQFSVQ